MEFIAAILLEAGNDPKVTPVELPEDFSYEDDCRKGFVSFYVSYFDKGVGESIDELFSLGSSGTPLLRYEILGDRNIAFSK